MNQPRDLGKTFQCAEDTQYLYFSRSQFRQRVLGQRRAGERDALGNCRRQICSAFAHFTDGFNEVAWISGLGDIALGADFARAPLSASDASNTTISGFPANNARQPEATMG